MNRLEDSSCETGNTRVLQGTAEESYIATCHASRNFSLGDRVKACYEECIERNRVVTEIHGVVVEKYFDQGPIPFIKIRSDDERSFAGPVSGNFPCGSDFFFEDEPEGGSDVYRCFWREMTAREKQEYESIFLEERVEPVVRVIR